MNNETNKEINELKKAISYCRFQKDRNWRNFQKCKSLLEGELSKLSTKSEEELTKKDILALVSCNCDYMRALNLYNYYKEELSTLLAKLQEVNGNVKDEQ